MKLRLVVLAAASLVGLSACNTLTGGGQNQAALLDAVKAVAQDPNCGHTDRLAVNLGAISTGSLFLERNCPAPVKPQPQADAQPAAQ